MTSAVSFANLYSVDTGTGAATLMGEIGLNMPGFTYRSLNATLYGVSGVTNSLYQINKTTGAKTLIGASGSTDSLYTLNMTTGAAVLVGPLGFNAGSGLGIAIVPEPSTALLLGLGLAGLATKRRVRPSGRNACAVEHRQPSRRAPHLCE